MWQALETKARFISQVITGDNAARRAEDIGGQELSYAEVKAIASGNPAVLTLAEADAELQRLSVLKKNHLDEQFVARRRVRNLPESIASMSEHLSNLSSDQAKAKTHATDAIAIDGRAYPREDIPNILGGKLDGLPKHVLETTRVPLGTYRGLTFGLILRPQFPPDVYLEGGATRQSMFARQFPGPRAVLNELERLANSYGPACDQVRQNLAIAEGQLRDYQARLGKPFTREAYLSELTSLRDQLKCSLSGAHQKEDKEEGPSISELAGRIKAIKAAHTVEATPQRVGQKHSSAEEPITTRIRRRTKAFPISDCVTEPGAGASMTLASQPRESTENATPGDLTSVIAADHTSISQDCSMRPELSFQERVARSRREGVDGPGV
jgi:hypothetical protein